MSKKMTNCKACGQEIAKTAKACPNCGAKNKKPIFKKWWFWAIIVVLFIAIGSFGNDASTENVENNDTKVESSFSTTEKETDTPKEDTSEQEATEQKETKETEEKVEMTTGQKNALKSAKSYLDFSAFSYEGLIKQLEFEKYTHKDAVFAADNCGADWNEQALKSAKSYLDFSAFSYTGLIKQLEFENYTTEQATYGADNCGADWNEQAAKSAKSYLEFSSFSKDDLIQQLEFEGFTKEQAEYGAKENGYE